MRISLLGPLALPLAACAGAGAGAADTPPGPVPANESGSECNAEAVQNHIGHDATEEMGSAILRESGAKVLRWGPPGAMWTMDHRLDRVNVSYNEAGVIIGITCG